MAAVAVAVVLLSNGGGGHEYTLRFQNAAQLVKGNLVQVSGRPVGDVREINLSDNAFQNATGLTVINANTGNNVAMNASLTVNVVMTAPE